MPLADGRRNLSAQLQTQLLSLLEQLEAGDKLHLFLHAPPPEWSPAPGGSGVRPLHFRCVVVLQRGPLTYECGCAQVAAAACVPCRVILPPLTPSPFPYLSHPPPRSSLLRARIQEARYSSLDSFAADFRSLCIDAMENVQHHLQDRTSNVAEYADALLGAWGGTGRMGGAHCSLPPTARLT